MVSVKGGGGPAVAQEQISLKKSELLMDIRQMAETRLEEKGPDGKLDDADVKALLARAYYDGGVDTSEKADLDHVKTKLRHRMKGSAKLILSDWSSNFDTWMKETQDQLKAQEAEAKAMLDQDKRDFREFSDGDKKDHKRLTTKAKKVKKKKENLRKHKVKASEKEVAILADLFGHNKTNIGG